jgi:hypothetical protein
VANEDVVLAKTAAASGAFSGTDKKDKFAGHRLNPDDSRFAIS